MADWLTEKYRGSRSGTLSEFRAAYPLKKKIGSGTFGQVYDACMVESGEDVVVKIVAGDISGVYEAQIQDVLSHRNILPILDSWVSPTYSALVFPKACMNLHHFVQGCRGNVTQSQLVSISTQMCKAIAYLHAQSILHRDLHAGNVLLTWQGGMSPAEVSVAHVEISDFGKSCIAPGDGSMVLPIHYRPPELLFAHGSVLRCSDELFGKYTYQEADIVEYDYNVDVWPLGCMLVLIDCGELPFGCSRDGTEYAKRLLSTMGAPSKQEIKMKRWTMLTTRIGIQFMETYSRRTAPPIWKRVERLAQSIFQYQSVARPQASRLAQLLPA